MSARSSRAWPSGPFLTHLNQRHPDTVLFLARHLTGDPDVSAAALVGVDAERLTMEVTSSGLPRTMTATLPHPVASRAELVTALGGVLADARAATPGGPLTSLETHIADSRGH